MLQLLEERGIARKTIDASPAAAVVHRALLGAITSVVGDEAVIPAAPAVAAAPAAAAPFAAIAPPASTVPVSATSDDAYSTLTDAYSAGGGGAYSAYSSLTDAYSAGAGGGAYSSVPASGAAAAAGPGGWALQSGEVWANSGSGERVAKRDAAYGVWTVELSRSQGMLYWYNKHTNARSYRAGAHAAQPPGL